MSAGALMMGFVGLVTFGSLGFIIFSMIRSIRDERTDGRGIWREFGLSLALMIMFFLSWFAHGVTEWQVYTDEQQTHGEQATMGDFVNQSAQSTLENWQSEFLQVWAFVTLAALYIHKGSAESKDSEDRMEAALERIEKKLGSRPA